MSDPFYNKTVTVWNRYVDGIWEKETWLPTVIGNVRLLVSRGNNIQNSGNSAADSARLHISNEMSIPAKPYLPAEAWGALPLDEKKKYFTLDSGNESFFIEGDMSSVNADVYDDGVFKCMKENYSNCFKITSVDRFEIIPHFEVWGK